MTKPEGISQSAWDEARRILFIRGEPDRAQSYEEHAHQCQMLVADAILAERERCALIAETLPMGAFNHPEAIAAAIRQGSQPSNAIPHHGTVRS